MSNMRGVLIFFVKDESIKIFNLSLIINIEWLEESYNLIVVLDIVSKFSFFFIYFVIIFIIFFLVGIWRL